MEATSAWGLMAAVFGLAAGWLLGVQAYGVLARREHVAAALVAGRRNQLALRLSGGFAPLKPLARSLLRLDKVAQFALLSVRLLEERGLVLGSAEFLSEALAAVLAAAVLAGLASGSAVCGVASGCCAALGGVGFVRSQREKRSLALREQVPEALRAMEVCFRSGLSLVQTLRQVSGEIGGVLGSQFAAAAQRLEMGASTDEALAAFREADRVPEMMFVAVALDVQHQSGGSMSSVLDAARESGEGEIDLMRSLRVQTAQAKLSARIVTLMPFILVALFSLMSKDFLTPFFTSFAGFCLLGLALSMQLAGVLMVRRMLRVEME